MKKRISIMLAVVLVLVTIMAVCLVGCGPKMDKEMKKAFKGVDMKDAKAIIGVIDKAIDNSNVTINTTIYDKDLEYAEVYSVKADGKKAMQAYKDKDPDAPMSNEAIGVEKDGRLTVYTRYDDEDWEKSEMTGTAKDVVDEMLGMMGINELLKIKFEYNKKDKNFTGTYEDEKITMAVVDNGIEFKMDTKEMTQTILFTNIGSTKIDVPTVK